MQRTPLAISNIIIAEFCRRWLIAELAVFGSALREDFNADSDIDLLVSFAPEARWSLLDHIQMEEELSGLLGRPVDLVSKRAVSRSDNWIRRKAILENARIIYATR
ncbi:MAG: hypothetical protein A2Z16_01270 [Chloroflexi bacterium RBG_16_54_18]|nr:MAG: hypothetical protein A2Z16_01270 [Chloroflexi bacterium RBG_16_54_18]